MFLTSILDEFLAKYKEKSNELISHWSQCAPNIIDYAKRSKKQSIILLLKNRCDAPDGILSL